MPDLLLLDLKMPRMSGFDVLEWKQSRPELDDVAAVVLSSSSQDSDLKEAYRLGAQGYLVKPATVDALVRQVKELGAQWLST